MLKNAHARRSPFGQPACPLTLTLTPGRPGLSRCESLYCPLVVRHAATVSGACLHSPASFLHPTSTHPWIHRPHIPAYPWAMQEVMHVPVVATLTLTLTLALTRR